MKHDRKLSTNYLKHDYPQYFPLLKNERQHVRFLKTKYPVFFKMGSCSKGDERRYNKTKRIKSKQ